MEAEARGEGRVEEALRVRQFENLPSPEDFSTEIEPTNVPAVKISSLSRYFSRISIAKSFFSLFDLLFMI